MAFDLQSLIGGSITDGVSKIISLFKVDPTVALEKKVELEEIQLAMAQKAADAVSAQVQGQLDIDKQEAASTNWFVAGWRPAIGWICAMGLGSQFIVRPLFTWVATLAKHPVEYPSLDLGTLLTLLFGMLGMAGYRTYEKTNGVDAAHPDE